MLALPRRSAATYAVLAALTITIGRATKADEEVLVTDRPDFTESAVSVDPGRVQLEAGYTFEDTGKTDVQSLGEVLVRIGWTESLELRLGLNSYVTVDTPRKEISGFEDTSVGIKIELSQGTDEPRFLEPEAALLVGTTLPTGSSGLGAAHLQPSVVVALAWTLNDRLGVGSNLGATWVSDGDQYLEGVATIALGIALNDSWGGYLEYFTILPESSGGSTQHFVDAGLTRLLSNDFQLDLRAGTELGRDGTDFFVGAGLAYRW